MADPIWMYRRGADDVESRLFKDGNVPEEEGWGDTPDIPETPPEVAPTVKKPGRPRKVNVNDDGE